MDTIFKAVTSLHAELSPKCQTLANHISRPASQRDARAIRETWEQIDNVRPRLSSMVRKFDRFEPKTRKELTGAAFVRQSKQLKAGEDWGRQVKIWGRIERMVAAHLNPPCKHLIPVPHEAENHELLKRMYYAFHALANPHAQSVGAGQYGCFADIPMPIHFFDNMMRAAYRILVAQGRAQGARFLDVGCGGGSKVWAARQYFHQCDGLEYDPAYYVAATNMLRVLGADRCAIHHGDALTFTGYDTYDVIYFYRPMKDDAMLEKLEQQVFRHARPGTVIVAPYMGYYRARTGVDCAKVANPVFVTGYTQDQADTLRADAEAVGEQVLTGGNIPKFDLGFWAPVVQACTVDW